MKNQHDLKPVSMAPKSISIAPKFWYGLSAASLLLWACLSVAMLLLCSCVSDGDEPAGPFPGTPEALLQSNAAKWKAHAKLSYSIDFGTESPDGTRTITCQAEKGVFKGQCLSVDTCCGEEPESTYVAPPHPVPGELLSSLTQRIAELGYDGAVSDNTSMTVYKDVSSGTATSRIGYHAEFDPEYGFPIRISSLGQSDPFSVLIERVEFH
jgi:hypothetical protein